MKPSKLFFLTLSLLIPLVGWGADKMSKKSIKLTPFKSILISHAWEVELIQGNSYQLTLESSEEVLAHTVAQVFSDQLVIEMKQTSTFSAWLKKNNPFGRVKMKATLTLPTFDHLQLSGAVKLSSLDEFKMERATINLSGASTIEQLKLNNQELQLEVSGASTFKGYAKNSKQIKIELSGSSRIDLENLNAEEIKAEVSGASSLTVVGVCKDIHTKVSGASSIKAAYLEAITGTVSHSGASNGSYILKGEAKLTATGASTIRVKGDSTHKIQNVAKGSSIKFD